jgi:hypothetical protein
MAVLDHVLLTVYCGDVSNTGGDLYSDHGWLNAPLRFLGLAPVKFKNAPDQPPLLCLGKRLES